MSFTNQSGQATYPPYQNVSISSINSNNVTSVSYVGAGNKGKTKRSSKMSSRTSGKPSQAGEAAANAPSSTNEAPNAPPSQTGLDDRVSNILFGNMPPAGPSPFPSGMYPGNITFTHHAGAAPGGPPPSRKKKSNAPAASPNFSYYSTSSNPHGPMPAWAQAQVAQAQAQAQAAQVQAQAAVNAALMNANAAIANIPNQMQYEYMMGYSTNNVNRDNVTQVTSINSFNNYSNVKAGKRTSQARAKAERVTPSSSNLKKGDRHQPQGDTAEVSGDQSQSQSQSDKPGNGKKSHSHNHNHTRVCVHGVLVQSSSSDEWSPTSESDLDYSDDESIHWQETTLNLGNRMPPMRSPVMMPAPFVPMPSVYGYNNTGSARDNVRSAHRSAARGAAAACIRSTRTHAEPTTMPSVETQDGTSNFSVDAPPAYFDAVGNDALVLSESNDANTTTGRS